MVIKGANLNCWRVFQTKRWRKI